MTALYLHEDVKELLSGKTLVVLGDSVERSVYKDLVCLLQENRYLSEQELRKKGEESFIGDELVYGGCKSDLKNSVNYRECRYFKTDEACCRYYFVTICYGPYVEEVLQELSQEPTDVIIMNSCLWDVHRHGKAGVEKYEENLEKLVAALQRLLPDCLFIWITTPPVHIKSKGGFLMQPGTDLVKINEVRYCNEIAREVFAEANELDNRFHLVDLDYVFRHFEHHRASDGVHWNARAHRRMSNMILEEVSKAFNKDIPRVLGSNNNNSWESELYEQWDSSDGWISGPYEGQGSGDWSYTPLPEFMLPPPPDAFPYPLPPFGPYGPPFPFMNDPRMLLQAFPFFDLDDLGHARQQVELQQENKKRKEGEDCNEADIPDKQYRFGFTDPDLVPSQKRKNSDSEENPVNKISIVEVEGEMKKFVHVNEDVVLHVVLSEEEKENYLKAKKEEAERFERYKKEMEEMSKNGDSKENEVNDEKTDISNKSHDSIILDEAPKRLNPDEIDLFDEQNVYEVESLGELASRALSNTQKSVSPVRSSKETFKKMDTQALLSMPSPFATTNKVNGDDSMNDNQQNTGIASGNGEIITDESLLLDNDSDSTKINSQRKQETLNNLEISNGKEARNKDGHINPVITSQSSEEISSSKKKKKKSKHPNETKEERRTRKKLKREKKEEKKKHQEKQKSKQVNRQRSMTWTPSYVPSYQNKHHPGVYTNDQPTSYQTYQQSVQQQQELMRQQIAISQQRAQQQALLLQQRQQQEAARQKALGTFDNRPTAPQSQLYIDEYGQTYTLEEETYIMGPSGQMQSFSSNAVVQQPTTQFQTPQQFIRQHPSLLYSQTNFL